MDEKRTAVIETRTSQAAEGKARMEHAHRELQALLWQRLHERQLPDFVGLFIMNHWYKVLIYVFLRYGQTSPQWLKTVQVVDDLLWAQQGQTDEKSRQRLNRLLPKLIVRLHSGLKAMGNIPPEAIDQLRKIKHLLEQFQAGKSVPVTHLDFNELASASQTELTSPPQKTWRDMTALERQQVKQRAVDFTYMQQANELQPGAWFIWENAAEGTWVRCKLAKRLDDLDRFIFVNRLGARVCDKDKKSVAAELQRGALRALDRSPMFDRALESIASSLRERIA